MSGTCDVAPWSPIPLGGKAGSSARAAQGAPVAAFDLRDALPGMVLAIEGASAPPTRDRHRARRRARDHARRRRGSGRRALPARRPWAHHVRRRARAARRALDADARAGVLAGDGGPPRRRAPRAAGEGARDRARPPPHAALDAPGDPRAGRPDRRGGPRERGRDRHDEQGARQQALRAGGRPRRPAVDRRRRRAGRDGAAPGSSPAATRRRRRSARRSRRASRLRRRGGALQVRWKRAAGARDYRVGPSSPTGAGCC